MKKAFMWIGIVLLSPILLFIILTMLLYLPPVQNWAVDKAAEVASESTGMQVTIDEVSLSFPLDLSISGVLVKQEADTIADIRNMVADVQLLPLFALKVKVDQLELNQAKINTLSMIPDLQVRGAVGKLSVSSRGIDLGEGMVELNGALLSDADMTILLNDTAAVDTTTSEPLPWLIHIDHATILNSRIDLHMPGDSMQVAVGIGKARAEEGIIDLLNSMYRVKRFEWSGGTVDYNLPYEPLLAEGLDYNHIGLTDIHVAIDSIYFRAPDLGLSIREAALKERSGLSVTQLTGGVKMDSVGIKLNNFLLATPYSNIQAHADVDLNVMDSIRPGQLHVNLNAALGKQDLMLFMADMPKGFQQGWPEWPLTLKGQVDGNTEQLAIEELEASLPTAFRAKVYGSAAKLTDMDHLLAQLNVEAETYNTQFVWALADAQMAKDYRIPYGLQLNGIVSADGPRYTADLVAREGKGYAKMKGWLAQNTMSYDARLQIKDLNLHHFMPTNTLYELSARANVKGHGTDFLKPTCRLDANATLEHLRFGDLNVDSVRATAVLNNGHALVSVQGNNDLMRGMFDVDALLDTKNIGATLSADLQKLDLRALQVVEEPLTVGLCGHIDLQSNLEEYHHVRGEIGEIYLDDSLKCYRPADVSLTVHTDADTTLFRLSSGDMMVKADASGGYEPLIERVTHLSDSILAQFKARTLDQQSIKRLLPTTRLYVSSGRNNPIVELMQTSMATYFKEMKIDMTSSPEKGINGDMHIFSLNTDSTRLDTIFVRIKESSKGLTFSGQVTNNRRNPQFVFNALIDGHIHEKGATMGLRFYDDRNELGLRLGAKASMEQDGVRVNLLPARPTLGYREFNLNSDNFLYLGRDMKLRAKVDLLADDGTGVKIYSEDQDSTMLQDLTVSLYRFDLDKLTSAIPYVPHIAGVLDGDFHMVMDSEEKVSVSSDMQVARMAYEDSPIGNVSTEFIYMQREDDTHALRATMYLENKEVLELDGSYQNKGDGYLDAILTFNHTPMNIVNGFVPDQLVGLEGFAEGELAVKGPTSMPKVDGEIYLNSAALVSIPYGVRLRFDDDPVRVINSKLLLENFTMYAHNDNPLNIMGAIDFHDTDRITMDVKMQAQDFQLINSKKTKESIAYGKAWVNFFAVMSGRLDQLRMRGRLDVLGKTNVNYILLDSPLNTDNRMEELVKFTDFSDSTQTIVNRPKPEGLDVQMNINIDEGTHVRCDLNADQTNYVDILGGGEMRMKYTYEEMSLTGRYTVSSGQMKYSLPVIPLKTFTIQDGSYVDFNGDMMNPKLNITATERTKAPVAMEGGQSRSVLFDCGVVITKTLNDMGLEFIIDAPEDMSISSELNSLTAEQRGKQAVTMLTTGMYLSDNNTNAFSMNSALNSFLQSEINNITGSALKTVDVSFDMDNSTDASGASRTDYSFKFAKRFWNNRLNVQIGGKVSTGSQIQGRKQSFFDNVAMEYRLTPTSNQYVKLFYNQNVYDWLEGYTRQYGAGYIWRRKLSSLKDIFKIWGNSEKSTIPNFSTMRRTGNDSIRVRKEVNDSTIFQRESHDSITIQKKQ